MGVLNGRIGIASQASRDSNWSYELALKYSQERKAFGKIFKHQAISFKLADMATQIMAAKCYVKAACEKIRIDIAQSGAMAKLFASQTAMDTTIEAVQIHGGNGYVAEYHVERMMRDAKITNI
jgi:alkylation response protein AidB-like acyl-CoA dehydrogenase